MSSASEIDVDAAKGKACTADDVWASLARQAKECRDQNERDWGGIDDDLITRFLSGRCTEDEIRRVEVARKMFPKVDECIRIVTEVDAVSPP